MPARSLDADYELMLSKWIAVGKEKHCYCFFETMPGVTPRFALTAIKEQVDEWDVRYVYRDERIH